ncbi:ferrochelatase [Candidatus Thiothrix sp. Deng01]|uniref:Ferrochelatase n=1 Tax=Candidatus Thiothrix phosphatis TaxID=3112415 RepID=A0ABU6CRD6_9GAMM|nr:ferrochelatase [Candidatus Thiothrix sp. Deng01]MEB4589410.1 ferrochelatase [Candidatus Thiothrix sp. Deng01]
MNRFINEKDYFHGKSECVGVLLVNLGTPDAPDTPALRRYLKEFLSDPRVAELPRIIWYPILYGFILNKRPAASALKYREVWTNNGSPLMSISLQQQKALQKEMEIRFAGPVKIAIAMRYGNPSIQSGLLKLKEGGAQRILILPLYPQYCAATTASTFDKVFDELKRWRRMPELRLVSHYHDHPGYISALADSMLRHWESHPRGQVLLMSFHGIPKRSLLLGDPYYCECQKTARLLAEELNLRAGEYRVTFQSRFGKAEWLQPYTDKTLQALPGEGVKNVDVICPGFAADCLETLEEIQQENRVCFQQAGGENYHYIPALNASAKHIQTLADLIQQHTQGWPETATHWNEASQQKRAEKTLQRAIGKGAKK